MCLSPPGSVHSSPPNGSVMWKCSKVGSGGALSASLLSPVCNNPHLPLSHQATSRLLQTQFTCRFSWEVFLDAPKQSRTFHSFILITTLLYSCSGLCVFLKFSFICRCMSSTINPFLEKYYFLFFFF